MIRKAAAILVLVSLTTGCAQMRAFGQGVCETQVEISQGISEIGAFFGTPGTIFTDAFNIVLNAGCRVFAATMALPQEGTDAVTELFAEEETDAAESEVPVEGDPGH